MKTAALLLALCLDARLVVVGPAIRNPHGEAGMSAVGFVALRSELNLVDVGCGLMALMF